MRLQFCLLFLSLMLAGCSQKKDWQAEVQPVSMQVTINGVAPQGAFLMFNPLGDPFDTRGAVPTGYVTDDGNVIFNTYSQGDGLPEGEFAVTIKWLSDPMKFDSVDRLNGAFLDVKRPAAVVEVKRGDRELPAIHLTGVKVKPGK